jgi:hypothetical protein
MRAAVPRLAPGRVDSVDNNGPLFIDQSAYTDAIVVAVRRRLRASVEATKVGTHADFKPLQDDERDLRASGRASANANVGMPLVHLCDRLKLTETEELAIWVLLANEIDSQSRQLLRDLNTEHAADPTVDTIRRVVYAPTNRLRSAIELAAAGPLRRLLLVLRTDRDETAPDYRQTIALSSRAVRIAHGETELDEALTAFASMSVPSKVGVLAVPNEAIEQVRCGLSSETALVVRGQRGSGRRSLIVACGSHRFLEIDCTKLSGDDKLFAEQIHAIERECRLMSAVPLFQHLEAIASGNRLARVDSFPGRIVATANKSFTHQWNRDFSIVDIGTPSSAQLQAIWAQAIPEASTGDAELMATMYPLAPAMIVAAGKRAHRLAAGTELVAAHIASGIRMVADSRLSALAKRIEVTQSWNDLVLPDDQSTALVELIARIRQRATVYEEWGFAKKLGKGLGVTALFSGPPGTGKTMAAALVARELGVGLFQIDLSKITSKWIGETEKSLAALFDAAEAAHAMLLFDEANSLFRKRTDVKGSNDKHANQEVNFLLQRLESFTGICVLTTNHENAIDEAFRRRLSVHIRLPVPEAEERRRIWRALIPQTAPVASTLDFDALARHYVMSGGYIRNAVLRAAFLAADTSGVIDNSLLARAAQLEYEAMGKVVTSHQF